MKNYLKYDNIFLGIAIGICAPIAAYGILLFLYEQLDNLEILNPEGLAPNFRERTIAIIALIANAIAMQWANNRLMTNHMRGIIFPTLVYVGMWMWFYGFELMNINV